MTSSRLVRVGGPSPVNNVVAFAGSWLMTPDFIKHVPNRLFREATNPGGGDLQAAGSGRPDQPLMAGTVFVEVQQQQDDGDEQQGFRLPHPAKRVGNHFGDGQGGHVADGR